MKIIEGDLIELAKQGHFDVIVQGCNCFNTMNSGIAKQIKDNFPEAYAADLLTPKGDASKLGTYSKATVGDLIIVNAYTQYRYGRDKTVQYCDCKAVDKVFGLIAQNFNGLRIGYPKIGAGLANGDWNDISEIIDKKLEGMDHTLVVFE